MKWLSFLAFASLSAVFATPVLARGVVEADVAAPAGFVVTAEVVDLESPSMIAFDDDGRMLIAENGDEPKITRIEQDGSRTAVVRGAAFGGNLPLTALNVVDGRIIVAHGEVISVLEPSGEFHVIGEEDTARAEFVARLSEPAHPPSDEWGSADDIFVAEPDAARIVRMHVDGSTDVFIENDIPSDAGGQGLGRPVHVLFSPDNEMYITDESGVIWNVAIGQAPISSVVAGWTLFAFLLGGFALTSLTYLLMRGGDRGVPAWQGAWRGLVATVATIVTAIVITRAVFQIPWSSIGRTFSVIVAGRSVAEGAITLVAFGTVFGTIFAALLRTRKPSRIVLAGTFFGLAVWAIVQIFVLRWAWPYFLVYGITLGSLVALMYVQRKRPTARRRPAKRRQRSEIPIELRPRRRAGTR